MKKETYSVYRTGVSWWLFGPILALFLGLSINLFLNGEEIMAGIFAILFFFFLHMLLNTFYVISKGKYLVIKAGFLYAKKVLVEDITRIEKTNIAIASPAASFNRMEIHYGKYSSEVISPKKQQQFLADLQSLNPRIKVIGFEK